MSRRHTNKGRSKSEGQFVALPNFMLDTVAYKTLPVYERAALVEVAKLYNGRNNGFLDLAVRTLARELNVAPNRANTALQVLVSRGFLKITEESGFSRKDRTSASYRITWKPCDRTHAGKSAAYSAWRPDPGSDAAAHLERIQSKKNTVARGERTVAPPATVVPLKHANSRTR